MVGLCRYITFITGICYGASYFIHEAVRAAPEISAGSTGPVERQIDTPQPLGAGIEANSPDRTLGPARQRSGSGTAEQEWARSDPSSIPFQMWPNAWPSDPGEC